jgi:hypothetical protein
LTRTPDGAIGENPNRIQPGMTLVIRPLSTFSAEEKESARRRHSTWLSYHRFSIGRRVSALLCEPSRHVWRNLGEPEPLSQPHALEDP